MALIAIDWDGTIVDNMNHQMGERFPPLFPQAKEAIRGFRAEGHKVMIFSCNNPKWIKECLEEYEIIVDYIWEGAKPVYDLLIDDRNVEFSGDWHEAYTKVGERLVQENH